MTFSFSIPTRLYFGEACVRKQGDELAALGRRALIVCGRHSAVRNGSLRDVQDALEQRGKEYVVFDRVMSNPDIDCVYQGAAFAKAQGVDFIIAIGGGSPMDAAKAIALLACQDIPRSRLFSGEYGERVLPMAHIPTTAGTGSEVTPYAVLTNRDASTKMSLSSPALFPRLALLDARYLAGVPHATAVHTAVDALSHLAEGMLSVRANPLTDTLAQEGLRRVSACFTALKSNTLTSEQREELLYASALGGMVIAHTGTVAVHVMGYPLTYFKNLDHGLANGLLLAAFLRFTQREEPRAVERILDAMGMKDTACLEETLRGLLGRGPAMEPEELRAFAQRSSKVPKIANSIVVPTQEDVLAIYQQAFNQ